MSRILILGSNGLLGQSLQKQFAAQGQIFNASVEKASYITDLDIPYYKVDLTKRKEVRELLLTVKPDIIINAAAYTNVDGCEEEKEQCWAVNVKTVENILEVPFEKNPLLVHISTDYVFDGERGGYREVDEPNPRGNYARSKLAAENIIRNSHMEYIIARTQILYGAGIGIKSSFVNWLVLSLQAGRHVQVVTDQIGNPTYAPDLAEAIDRLIDKEAYGLFHVSGPEALSRYAFALIIADVFELDKDLIEPVSSSGFQQKAPRPGNSSFVLDKLYNNIQWLPHTVRDALDLLKKEMKQDA